MRFRCVLASDDSIRDVRDGSVDVFVANGPLNGITPTAQLLDDMLRVLNPTGVLHPLPVPPHTPCHATRTINDVIND